MARLRAVRATVAVSALEEVQHLPDVDAVLVGLSAELGELPTVLGDLPALLLEARVVLLQAVEDLADLALLLGLLLGERGEPKSLFAHEAHEGFDLTGEVSKVVTGVRDVPFEDGGEPFEGAGCLGWHRSSDG